MRITNYILGSTLIIFLLLSCTKTNNIVPSLTILKIQEITSNSVTVNYEFQNGGGALVTDRGVCWSIRPNPTILDTRVSGGSGIGSFSTKVTGLSYNTIYYVRAYGTNAIGTGYSEQLSFTTSAGLPSVSTNSILSITSNSSVIGGTVHNDGGSSVTARGVCWSTTQNPTISNSKTIDGSGIGTFTSSITGLSPNTTYYIRVYATNSAGTSYGSQQSIKTDISSPTFGINTIGSITTNSAVCLSNIISDGGFSISSKGVCWSTNQNPTTSHSKTSDGSGLGTFSSQITGLTPNTTYYVRTYGTNSYGTWYGNNISFMTLPINPLTDIDGNQYTSVTIGSQIWMKENLMTTKMNDGSSIPNVTDNNQWNNMSSSAYCWYNNSSSNKTTLGALYNWYAANSGKLCPSGWRVPSQSDWTTLINYLGGLDVAGQKLKTTGTTFWNSPNSGASNSSGFSALGAGWRNYSFLNYLEKGSFITTTTSAGSVIVVTVYHNQIRADYGGATLKDGFSVRCLKN